jgi:biotin operon repressor
MDRRARSGPWTRKTLELIRAQPGVRAADLAAELGRPRDDFKQDVRRLKRLGLTISLEIGYRLSPLGEAFLGRRVGGCADYTAAPLEPNRLPGSTRSGSLGILTGTRKHPKGDPSP